MYLNSMYSNDYKKVREVTDIIVDDTEYIPKPNIRKITKRNMLSSNLLKTYDLTEYKRVSIVLNSYRKQGLVIDPLLKGHIDNDI